VKIADDIEAEMRSIGLWNGRAGTLEHWLQHDYLPTLRKEKRPKPIGVYDRAHAEWVKWGPEDEGPTKLLGLLRRLDRILEFRPSVLRFGFYSTKEGAETPGGFTCVWGRALSNAFPSAETWRIAWQVEMQHPARATTLDMVLEWTIMRLDQDKLFKRGTHRSILPAAWTQMAFAESYGWDAPGHWPRARYRTTLAYWGEPIAEDEFTIE
jgi:hypothetical protein